MAPPIFWDKSIFWGIFFLAMKNLGNFRHEEKRIIEKYLKMPEIEHLKHGYSNAILIQISTSIRQKWEFLATKWP